MERFVIISSGLQPLTNHKVLHLGCCSSPRSASGLNAVWRKAIFWILLFGKFEPFFFFSSPSNAFYITCRANEQNIPNGSSSRSNLLSGRMYPLLFWKYENFFPKKITTSLSAFSALLALLVFFYLSIFNRIKSFCGLYGYL